MKRIISHLLFWVLGALFLVLFLGGASEHRSITLTQVALLLPVALGTSYLFNYRLLPNYLFERRYGKFILYGGFTVVASIYLQMMVILLSFIVLADYRFESMNPASSNILNLAVGMYLLVFLSSLIYLVRRWNRETPKEPGPSYLVVKANRESIKIPITEILYVESLDNYVKIHSVSETIITKEGISHLANRLPDFLRIHRSFLVNEERVGSFTRESVSINGAQLPISRTYRKAAFVALSQD